jgi:hypothetical protein
MGVREEDQGNAPCRACGGGGEHRRGLFRCMAWPPSSQCLGFTRLRAWSRDRTPGFIYSWLRSHLVSSTAAVLGVYSLHRIGSLDQRSWRSLLFDDLPHQ